MAEATLVGGEERWLPIESNPEVLTSFLGKLGVPPAWQIHDVWGLEPELLLLLPQPVLGLMLLFPITEQYRDQEAAQPQTVSEKLYYMKQTVSNACGTVALLHCVANGRSTGRLQLEPSSPLEDFLQATAELSPEERAVRLEGEEAIVRVHDEAAREGQTAAPDLEDKVDYHFVAIVEVDGGLYQLDGRRSGPELLGPCPEGEFLTRAATVCKEFMARDPTNLHFTVMALAPRLED